MMGFYFEEFENGMNWPLGEHRFTREAILRFAKAYDPQPFHVDEAAASESPFGAIIASGWHTAAGWMRCFVDSNERGRRERQLRGEALPEIGPSPGLTNIKWLRPVYAGDVVAFTLAITGKRPLASRRQWGIVEMHTEGRNQKDELAFAFDGKVLVARRSEPLGSDIEPSLSSSGEAKPRPGDPVRR
jgi:acyl dehydratase